MNQNEQLGAKIKSFRVQQQLTLKQLAQRADLSVGFLSQVERGLAALSLNTLAKLASAFGIDISAFFSEASLVDKSLVVRSYERNCLRITPEFLHYSMCTDLQNSSFFPEIYELFPGAGRNEKTFQHKQEEYVYVLEGVLSVRADQAEYILNPGDGMRIPTCCKHIWRNNTTQMVKVFSVALNIKKQEAT